MERKRHPGPAVPHFVEPVLGLAEGETRGLNAGYGAPVVKPRRIRYVPRPIPRHTHINRTR
jgi:hypothetical protein